MAQDTVKQIVVLEVEIPTHRGLNQVENANDWDWDALVNYNADIIVPAKVLAYRLSEQEELTWIDET